ncbi:MAG: hypothetical protein ACRD3E_14815, partial [Terriglobales bacterium]
MAVPRINASGLPSQRQKASDGKAMNCRDLEQQSDERCGDIQLGADVSRSELQKTRNEQLV